MLRPVGCTAFAPCRCPGELWDIRPARSGKSFPVPARPDSTETMTVDEATQSDPGSTQPVKKRRVGMWLAVAVGIVVLGYGALVWYGSRPAVITQALLDEIDADKGQFIDEVTRLDGGALDGTTVVARFTVFDSFLDNMPPNLRQVVSDDVTLREILELGSEVTLGEACAFRANFVEFDSPVTLLYEHRDERGEVLLRTEASDETCRGPATRRAVGLTVGCLDPSDTHRRTELRLECGLGAWRSVQQIRDAERLEGAAQLVVEQGEDLRRAVAGLVSPPDVLPELRDELGVGLAHRRGQVALAEFDDGALTRRAPGTVVRGVLTRLNRGESCGEGAGPTVEVVAFRQRPPVSGRLHRLSLVVGGGCHGARGAAAITSREPLRVVRGLAWRTCWCSSVQALPDACPAAVRHAGRLLAGPPLARAASQAVTQGAPLVLEPPDDAFFVPLARADGAVERAVPDGAGDGEYSLCVGSETPTRHRRAARLVVVSAAL